MINDLKLGIKVLRYAYGVKLSIVSAVLFVLVAVGNFGLGMTVESMMWNNIMIGGVLLACTILLSVQLIHSLNVSSLIQSSPRKKRMQTSVPAILSGGGMCVMYLLCAAAFALLSLRFPERTAGSGGELIMEAFLMAVLMMYMGVAYKYFLAASLVLYPILFITIYASADKAWFLSMPWLDSVSFPAAFFIGLALVIIGCLAQYLLSLAVYKAPMSKMAQMAPLRKEL